MRIASYNIRGGLGMDQRRDTKRILGALSSSEPDIVCFQEVHQGLPQSAWIDQPRLLREGLGVPVVFQPNLKFLFGGYGVAIAARFPVQSVSQHRLPSVGETRGALEVNLETPEGNLTVFCTHFGLNRNERKAQAQALAGHIKSARLPIILCGDLNESPQADYLLQFKTDTGLVDWDAAFAAPTFPSDSPRSRIDVIFGSPELILEEFGVIKSLASDHLPIAAKFHWKG